MAYLIRKFLSIAYLESDHTNIKAQKSFLFAITLIMNFGSLLWASICLYYGLVYQSLLPFSYFIISMVNIASINYNNSFDRTRFTQLLISVLLPFIFQWSLGGFSASGWVIVWSFMALIASLQFDKIKESIILLSIFVLGLLVSALYENFFFTVQPAAISNASVSFLTLNIIVLTSFVFGLVFYTMILRKGTNIALQDSEETISMLNETLKGQYKEFQVLQRKLKGTGMAIESRDRAIKRNLAD